MTALVLAWHAGILPRPTASRRDPLLAAGQERGDAHRLRTPESRATLKSFHRLRVPAGGSPGLLQPGPEEALHPLSLAVVAQDGRRADERRPSFAAGQPRRQRVEL